MNDEHDHVGEAGLRMALHGLRQDIEPSHDLWPGIAARLQSVPQQSRQAPRRLRPDRLWPLAIAASLALAVGLAWQIRPMQPTQAVVPEIAQVSPSNQGETLLQREADSMTVHYEAALREMASTPLPANWQPGLDALDRSAVEIRSALQQEPNSRLLLQRLRDTYTRRIALARRAIYA